MPAQIPVLLCDAQEALQAISQGTLQFHALQAIGQGTLHLHLNTKVPDLCIV